MTFADSPSLETVRGAFARMRDFAPRREVRDLRGLPASLARAGSLEARLAVTKSEIRKVQKLRYKVFFRDGGAIADLRGKMTRRDICPFDRVCDHLYVVDHAHVTRLGRRKPKVVGVYRLLPQDVAKTDGGFYSANEFDVAPLLARHPAKRFLELGRSCVHPKWRDKRTLELLWRGLWIYARHHRIDALIGCASLPGTDLAAHAATLAFLRREASADAGWNAPPLGGDRIDFDESELTPFEKRRAFAALPPLVKGYLRVGAKVGSGVYVDHMFGVTDIFIILRVADIEARYLEHFTEPLPRAA